MCTRSQCLCDGGIVVATTAQGAPPPISLPEFKFKQLRKIVLVSLSLRLRDICSLWCSRHCVRLIVNKRVIKAQLFGD